MKTGSSASELRIGNWIEYLGEQSQCDVNTIYAISLISKPRDSVMYKPIPLTDDWHHRFPDTYTWDTYETVICISVSTGDYEIKKELLQYVHQWQNLYFALTQTELQTALSGKNEKG